MNQILQPMRRYIQNHAIHRIFIASRGQGTLFSENAVNSFLDIRQFGLVGGVSYSTRQAVKSVQRAFYGFGLANP